MNTPRVIRLNGEDNVVIAIDLVNQGDPAHGLTARQRIHKGHKMAIEPIREGEPVRKFNQIIGFAKSHIAPGEWVHEHNVGLHDFARDYRFAEDAHDDGLLSEDMRATFEGYRRQNGRAGTRNYIGILTSVNCSASVARFAAAAVERSGALADYPKSTASSRSCTAPAAAMPPMARASRSCGARNGATPATRTSPASSWSASAARCSRSAA